MKKMGPHPPSEDGDTAQRHCISFSSSCFCAEGGCFVSHFLYKINISFAHMCNYYSQ